MLINLPLAVVNAINDLPGEGMLAILDIIGGNADAKRIVALDKGVYQIQHFSFANMLMPVEQGGIVVSDYPFDPWMSQDRDDPDRITKARVEFETLQAEGYPDAYGVCDTPAQLLEKHPILATCPGQHVVSMTHIAKNPESEGGGWRWHKWGSYIGDGKPECEYLDDENGFDDGVWVFHILEVRVPEEWS